MNTLLERSPPDSRLDEPCSFLVGRYGTSISGVSTHRTSSPGQGGRWRKRMLLGLSMVLCLGHVAYGQDGHDDHHGDHNPHHGGVVLMYGLDLHYEVVLKPSGEVELWLSNAARTELPASVVSDVAAEIEAAGKRQNVDMSISGSGDAWTGKAAALQAEGTTLHLGFVYQGSAASISLPATSLMGEGREKLINDSAHGPVAPAATPAPSTGHEGHGAPAQGSGGHQHQGHDGHPMAAAQRLNMT